MEGHQINDVGTGLRTGRRKEKKKMQTEKLWISGMVRRIGDMNEIVQEFADRTGISGRNFQHLCLLTEETLGMAGQMLEDCDGEIWLEKTASGYEIILEADVRENRGTTPAQDASPEGFMAKIAGMLNCSYVFENVGEMPEDLAGMLPDYMSYGIRNRETGPAWAGRWSLSAYRTNLQESLKSNPGAGPVLEELEKSIVAQLADEVTIGIHGRKIRLVISKRV